MTTLREMERIMREQNANIARLGGSVLSLSLRVVELERWISKQKAIDFGHGPSQ